MMELVEKLAGMADNIGADRAPFDDVKPELEKLANHLAFLQGEKDGLEDRLSQKNAEIVNCQNQILKLWGPYIEGCNRSELKLNDGFLKSELVLNTSVEDMDEVVKWLEQNQPDVLRLQVHHSTLKSVAKKRLEAEGETIPGLKYSTFTKVKVSF
jgi:regulator of replication initiation timing